MIVVVVAVVIVTVVLFISRLLLYCSGNPERVAMVSLKNREVAGEVIDGV